MQIQQGAAVPITYGTFPLQADGTLLGRRLAALIAIRDHPRRVLQSQNEGWPEVQRHEARRALNGVYGRFVAAYGPINKTTLSTTTDGTTIRRMPNLVMFRDDPDAMLVMALEHYDERTGVAEKAAILHRDVVGHHTPRTTVQSAEEGLLAATAVAHVTAIWQRTMSTRSTQLIFADLGIHPTPWGYSVYPAPMSSSGSSPRITSIVRGNVRRSSSAMECVAAHGDGLRVSVLGDVPPSESGRGHRPQRRAQSADRFLESLYQRRPRYRGRGEALCAAAVYGLQRRTA
jgi:hypothetical protein